jgi:hypothetical protein
VAVTIHAQTAQRTAEASERVVRAGADMLQHNAEIMQQAWEASSTMAVQLTQQSADQIARALGLSGEEAKNAAQQSSARVRGRQHKSTSPISAASRKAALPSSPNDAGGGMRSTSGWINSATEYRRKIGGESKLQLPRRYGAHQVAV